MKILSLAFSALAAFLMVFFADMLLLAPSMIARAWGLVAITFCAFAMIYLARD